MAPGRLGLWRPAKALASAAFFLAGAVAGTGLYFGNLAYVTPNSVACGPVTYHWSDGSRSAPRTITSFSCDYPPLSITTGSLPRGSIHSSYSAKVSVTGGHSNYQWSASGLPSGLSIDPASGVISGDPQETGSFTVIVTVTDGEHTPQLTIGMVSLTIS
jgi:hypothetical protein